MNTVQLNAIVLMGDGTHRVCTHYEVWASEDPMKRAVLHLRDVARYAKQPIAGLVVLFGTAVAHYDANACKRLL